MPNYDEDYDPETVRRLKNYETQLAKAYADAQKAAQQYLLDEIRKKVPNVKVEGKGKRFSCGDEDAEAMDKAISHATRSPAYQDAYDKALEKAMEKIKL